MTVFIPVMDFSVLPSISPILPLSLLQKFARLHAKLLLDGCKEKKRKASLKTLPGHLFADAPGIFSFIR